MIQLQEVTVMYGERHILNHANLELNSGEVAYLTGKSGAGKSTLMKLLTKEITPNSGQLLVHDIEQRQWKKYELRRQFGVVFQNFELLQDKTVLENVYLSAEVRGISVSNVKGTAFDLLQRVGLSGREHEYPSSLSGGEQQRVAIVRALISSPSIMLADEPTGNLDQETAFDLMDLLHRLQKEARFSLLIITHDHQLIQKHPAKHFVLEDGKVSQQ